MSSPKYEYWIPSWNIKKSVITSEIQYFLGPEATVRAYANNGEEGFLITTPGGCLTDEQIDDICRKSEELADKQAAARSKKDSDKQLKRPLHQPIIVSRGSKSSGHRRHSDERDGGSRPHRDHRDYVESSRR